MYDNITLRINGIINESIVDGPGFRYTIFVQGCPHHCKGCHNPQTHDFDGGYNISINEILVDVLKNPLLSGVTFSGGEPFCQSEPLLKLAELLKKRGLSIVCFSGYTFEELLELGKTKPSVINLLKISDMLIDGRYIEEQRDLTLQYRGSANQRIIDLKKIDWNNPIA